MHLLKTVWALQWRFQVRKKKMRKLYLLKSVWDLAASVWSPYYIFFGRFKTSPPPLQLFGRTLRCCFAVKLQKSLMYYESSPDFPSVHYVWIYLLNCHFLRWIPTPSSLHNDKHKRHMPKFSTLYADDPDSHHKMNNSACFIQVTYPINKTIMTQQFWMMKK